MSNKPLLVIPVGSYEQHGAHLPPDTDTRVAIYLAESLASDIENVVMGPEITISASGEHAGFKNTLSIGNEVFISTLVEIARSADWCSGIVFVNGHGGNAQALKRAIQIITLEGRRAMEWTPNIPGSDSHAGHTETSLMLAINPQIVQMNQAVIGNTQPLSSLISEIHEHGIISVSSNGVLGDPTQATAEDGQKLLHFLRESLVSAVTNWNR